MRGKSQRRRIPQRGGPVQAHALQSASRKRQKRIGRIKRGKGGGRKGDFSWSRRHRCKLNHHAGMLKKTGMKKKNPQSTAEMISTLFNLPNVWLSRMGGRKIKGKRLILLRENPYRKGTSLSGGVGSRRGGAYNTHGRRSLGARDRFQEGGGSCTKARDVKRGREWGGDGPFQEKPFTYEQPGDKRGERKKLRKNSTVA